MVKTAPLEFADVTLDASQQLLERTEEMEQDLMAARAVQRFLMPPEFQDFSTHRMAYLYHPLHHIGGDFLDVARHSSGQTMFMVADVSGHGVAAAMSSAMLKTVFIRHAADSADPGEILTRVDQELNGMVRFGRFITALVAAYDPVKRTVKLASAGHPPPLLVRDHAAGAVDMETELPLLTGETPQYVTAATIQLQPRDRLLMYTDGVIEVARKTEGMLGVEGLIDLVNQVNQPTAPEFLEALFTQLFFGEFIFRDDVSFMCLDV